MEKLKPDFAHGSSKLPNGPRRPLGQYAGLVLAFSLELAMGVLFFGVFSETMGLASNLYLCDLPMVGAPFCALDEDATVSHLLAFLLAVFSIAVPLMIWSAVLRENIHKNPQEWLADPINKIKAVLALAVYAAVVGLEVINLYTLIAQETVANPFGSTGPANPLMEFLAENKGLGIFVALLIAVVNTVLALITVSVTLNFNKKGNM